MVKKQQCPFLDDAGVDANSAENGIEICLNCPRFPKPCIYEVTTQSQRKRHIRRARVKVLCDEGKPNRVIADLLGVSRQIIENDVRVNKEKE